MKKQIKSPPKKALLLSTEKVRDLEPEQLEAVVGGQCTKSYGGVGHH